MSMLMHPPERWCQDQKRTCPMICSNIDDRKVMANDCDPVCFPPPPFVPGSLDRREL